MAHKQNTSPVSPETVKQKKHKTNWHEAACCAVQIELRDYADILEFKTEYIIGRNKYRIDLLVVKKISEQVILKNIARIFKSFNLFEVKGIGSSLNTDSYYKTIGYAGLFIEQTGEANQYTGLDVTITFLCLHYPRNLIRHLKKERNLEIKMTSPGVYHIIKETFDTQIIVTQELPPKENLYLKCLTNRLQDAELINRLANDYESNQTQDIYTKYMNQLTKANSNNKEGESPMICEGILNLCGTSSEEIIARTKKEEEEYYLPKIKGLTNENEQLTSSNKQLSSENKYLKELLKQNNIPLNFQSANNS